MDVGLTCVIARWIPSPFPTPFPTPAPTLPDATEFSTPAPTPGSSCADRGGGSIGTCYSSGDPHMAMFAPGKTGHPQGQGAFVFDM